MHFTKLNSYLKIRRVKPDQLAQIVAFLTRSNYLFCGKHAAIRSCIFRDTNKKCGMELEVDKCQSPLVISTTHYINGDNYKSGLEKIQRGSIYMLPLS
jgi:hypothetical protein